MKPSTDLLRVIRALVLRELVTRFGRGNLGFWWLIGEPLLFTGFIAVMWSLVRPSTVDGISTFAFAVTGYSVVLAWRHPVSRCIGALEVNWALQFHTQVTPLRIMLARIVLEWLGSTCALTLLAAFGFMMGWMRFPVQLGGVAFAWTAVSLFGAGLGLVLGAMNEQSEIVEKIWHVAAYLLFPFSGALFYLEWMPSEIRPMFAWFPPIHATELLRQCWFGTLVIPHLDISYLCLNATVLPCIGCHMVMRCPRRLWS